MNAAAGAVLFPDRIGLGTWKLGESAAAQHREIAGVSQALEIGYRLIDTAEMYGAGGAERVVGGALKSFGSARRSELFITTKVLPNHASRRGTVRACEASLARLGCGYIDLYLLHWRGSHSLGETLAAFDELLDRGVIRHFGVSNFDVADLAEWRAAEAQQRLDSGGRPNAARAGVNQVFYCAAARGIEYDLLPWQRQYGFMTMAYSPLGLGALAANATLADIGRERNLTAAQVALAWVTRQPDVVAIPKSSHARRLQENLAASHIQLTDAELARIDAAFPPPRGKQPLAMI